MKKISFNINLATILIILLVLLTIILGGWKLNQNKVNNLENKLISEIKLKNSLLDSTRYYQNKEKEWVAEKLTIQGSVKNIEKINSQLSESQKELLSRVKELNKTNVIISAALIQTQIKLDSLLLKGQVTIDTAHKKITFFDKYVDGKKTMNYNFTVGNVIPSPTNAKPTLLIGLLEFPNSQLVEFHWKNNKKEGYPIAFSVSNSNDFFRTVNVDSYIIPEINKEKIKPTGWQKFGSFFSKTGNRLIFVGIGGVIGVSGYMFLTK